MELRSRQAGRRFRRALAAGLLASTALHAALFLLWRGEPVAGAPGIAARAATAAEARPASGGMRALELAPVREEEIPAPPAPILSPEAPELEWEEPAEAPDPSRISLERPGTPGDAGGEEGDAGEAGREDGAGTATGPGTGAEAPVPRSLFPQWDPPAAVRGLQVTVHVEVDAEGRPTGEVRLDPPTPDRRFNRRLVEEVRRMEYHPARRNGEPVPGWARITFIF